MRYIKKSAPQEYIRWAENWPLDYPLHWEDIDSDGRVKSIIKEGLLKEQGFICCYCEIRIDDRNSHIEHFRPRSFFPEESADYNNLLCSCQKNPPKGEPKHCGTKKGNWYDKDLLISPLEENCEGRFRYTFDGKINPANKKDNAAIETIEKLGLNIKTLTDSRKKVLEYFIEELITKDIDDVVLEIRQLMVADSEGKYPEFCTTLNYFSNFLSKRSAGKSVIGPDK